MKSQSLLRKRAQALGLNITITSTTVIPTNAIPVNFTEVGSPETYFGSAKNEYLANGKRGAAGVQVLPGTIKQTRFILSAHGILPISMQKQPVRQR